MACQWTYPYIGTHHNSQYEKSEGTCTGFVAALLKNQPRLHAYEKDNLIYLENLRHSTCINFIGSDYFTYYFNSCQGLVC